jgi:septum formation protein
MTPSKRLVLASQSPRRSELLSRAGFEFSLAPSQISEIPNENLNLDEQIQDLARRKAEECLRLRKLPERQGNLIISADTVVVLDGQILGKPQDRLENAQYLRRLSGRQHSVITAICLLDVDTGRSVCAHETSLINFKNLGENEIDVYASSGEGLDKAGGYGIQGAAGIFVKTVEGPYDNVVGLPIALLEKMLKENGWHVERS